MKKTIELHKRWKDDPSKGEVFTPEKLVCEMLDKIPEFVWKNPTTTFLDPCMGKGTFLIEIVRRLINIYGYSKEEAISRVYGYDIRVKYINYLKRGGLVNIFHKDFLKENIKMKFDVVVGNPPYQDSNKPGDNALYQHFTKKVLSELLKDTGYFSFVLPTTMCDYLLLCPKNRNYITNFYNIKSMVFDFPEDFFKKMGVGTTAFYFTIKNEIITEEEQNIEITYKRNGERKVINKVVKKGEILPKKNFEKYDELVNRFISENCFDFKVMKLSNGGFRRIRKKQIDDGLVSREKTETHCYPIIDKITKRGGLETYFINEKMVDYEQKKVVFSKTGYPMATYIETPVNLSDNMMYLVVENEIEGKNLCFVINSKVFYEVIDLFSTNARDLHKIISKIKKVNLTEKIIQNENEIYDFFTLDKNKYIE
jgi:hypothetical protein